MDTKERVNKYGQINGMIPLITWNRRYTQMDVSPVFIRRGFRIRIMVYDGVNDNRGEEY